MSTIFAVSTGRGPAGIAVVRLSGPQAGTALDALSRRPRPPVRKGVLRRLIHPVTGAPLDDAMVLWFEGPASATGEDVAELHLHGGPAVVAAVLQALGTLPGLVPAEPGAFARRAFDNGKLDLTAVEGLADLLTAETEAQRAQAFAQLSGRLAALVEGWRERLVRALAHVEAELDFGEDEGDVPGALADAVRPGIATLNSEIAAVLAEPPRGERLREGLAVAIIGPPNAGKSSLLNALSERQVAIVSAIPGTTRDAIEVRLNLGGYPVTLIDTAGLRETDDPVEAEGVRRARARAASADLALVLTPADVRGADAAPSEPALDQLVTVTAPEVWSIVSKCDLDPAQLPGAAAISTTTGAGLPAFVGRLTDWAATQLQVGEAPALTRARHRHAVEETAAHLEEALRQPDPVLLAEALRLAARALGRITGRIDVDALLDVIFRDFCIGK
jgi:tRNA modification GTPase